MMMKNTFLYNSSVLMMKSTFSQLGVTDGSIIDLILTRSNIKTRFVTDTHFGHLRHA